MLEVGEITSLIFLHITTLAQIDGNEKTTADSMFLKK